MSLVTVSLILFGLTLIGIPIAWALGAVGLLGVLLTHVPLQVVPHITFGSAEVYTLVAIPMFMLMGALIEKAGLGQVLVDFASSLVGWARGGLAQVNVLDSLFFGGLSGSAAADVASLGSIVIPEMKRRGYPPEFAAAITSSTAEMSIIIPPSIVMIVYASLANVSVGKLFIAGVVPGLVVGLSYMALCAYFARRHDWPIHEPFRMRRVIATGINAAGAMIIPIVIMGGILGGVFTATEASAVGVVVTALLIAFVYRTVRWSGVAEILVVTAKRTGIVMVVIAASGTLAWYLSHEQIPQKLAASMLAFSSNKYVILLIVDVFLIFLGMILSGTPAMILVVPVLLPILTQLGVDPIHFGIVFTLAVCVGSQTPPVAATMLLTCLIAKVTIAQMWKYNKWFVLVCILVMVVVTYVPDVAMWLPNTLFPE